MRAMRVERVSISWLRRGALLMVNVSTPSFTERSVV